MKPDPVVPPHNEIQFLLSLLRISFPGRPETGASAKLERLANLEKCALIR